jgi:hypothetical protein
MLASDGTQICRRIGCARTKTRMSRKAANRAPEASKEDPHVETIHSTEVGHVGRTLKSDTRPDRIGPWLVCAKVRLGQRRAGGIPRHQ